METIIKKEKLIKIIKNQKSKFISMINNYGFWVIYEVKQNIIWVRFKYLYYIDNDIIHTLKFESNKFISAIIIKKEVNNGK